MAATDDDAGHEGLSGRGGRLRTAGKDFDPSAPMPARSAPAVARLPRPTRSRVPIPQDAFAALKVEAKQKDAPLLDLKASTVTADRVRTQMQEVAAAGAAAPAFSAAPALAPVAAGNFEGIAFNGSFPFDATVAAGPQHVLASVNTRVAIYSTNGGAALVDRSLESWFANVLTEGNVFDPKALYDQHAGRWVLLAVAFSRSPDRAWFLLSVSKSEDPLGEWWNHALDAGVDNTTKTKNWADYPGLGVDNQALYLTANMFPFDPNGGFEYVKIRIIPKAGPYAGGSVPFRDIT